MESKYYTPTIEEFHVGFECELSYTKNENYTLTNLDIIDLEFLIQKEPKIKARVKYLDKEDIESLGWKLNNTGGWWELGNLFPKDKYNEGDHYLGNWKYRIIGDNVCEPPRPDMFWIDTRNPSNGGQLQIFRGTIKNKSELKKLMQQLGIE